MSGHKITCPYCFNEFNDDDVHFRMETVYAEDDLDPIGEGRSLDEIEVDSRYSSVEIKEQMAEFKRREQFVKRDDTVYQNFWAEFAGTTEKASLSRDGKEPSVLPYHRPVFDPKNAQHAALFGKPKRNSDVVNESGMVYAAVDCFGKLTQRRVCPHCHNPLPGAYGKYPVKFVSIIGITGAGKTVYLSQLSKYVAQQIAYFDIVANPTSQDVQEYIEANPVVMGEKLPVGSPPEQLLQPLCWDLVYGRGEQKQYQTIVFFDIAGENCVSAERIQKFGHFVERADGIIVVIDPKQFQFATAADAEEPVKVLQTISNVYQNRASNEVRKLPLSICLSKGDKIAQSMIRGNLDDIQAIQLNNGQFLPKFNAENYNPIHDAISAFVQQNDVQLSAQLNILYDNFNYFLFSAIGTSTHEIEVDGEIFDTPEGITIPKRILEPIVWMLYKFRFIEAHGEIHEPKDWFCDVCTTKKRLRYDTKYCPIHKTNNMGGWVCPECGTENVTEGEKPGACDTKTCKCFIENGVIKKPGLFKAKVLNRP